MQKPTKRSLVSSQRSFLRYNLYTIVWALLIATLVLLPGRNMPQLGSAIISVDKAVHASLFFVLTFLMNVGFAKQSSYPWLRNKAFLYTFILSIAYATIVEVMQLFSEGRSFEISDMVANISGCFAGFLFLFAIYK